MSTYDVLYRATVYKPRSVSGGDTDPLVGATHGEDFQVTTQDGVAGWAPYLDRVTGRFGRLDPLTGRTDTGEMTLRVVDAREGVSNTARWLSEFTGDVGDRPHLVGCKVFIERSLDDGATWSSYFTGRVHRVALSSGSRIWWDIVVRDMADGLRRRIFTGRPHADVTYASPALLLPHGFVAGISTYGGFPLDGKTTGTSYALGTGGEANRFGVQLETDQASRWNTAVGAALDLLLKRGRRWRHLDQVDVSALGRAVIQRSPSGQVTGVVPQAYAPWDAIILPASVARGVRLRITHTSGASSGSTGTYELRGMAVVTLDSAPTVVVWSLDAHPLRTAHGGLDTGHAEYLAAPADDVTVELTLAWDTTPEPEAPLYIDDVHPATLWRDLLDGEYSTLASDGTPAFAVAYDSATASAGVGHGPVGFTALIADTRLATSRYLADGPADRAEWVDQYICQPHRLGYRFDGDGQLVPLDLRMPIDLTGVLTITDADLAEDGSAPLWANDATQALSGVEVATYTEAIPRERGLQPLVMATQLTHLVPFAGDDARVLDHGENDWRVDALGLRSRAGELINTVQSRAAWVANRARLIAESLRSTYSHAPQVVVLACRRTTNTSTCAAGDLRIVSVSEIPDPQTNARGGTRIMRCLGVVDDGPRIAIELLDLGVNVVAESPTVAAPAQEAGNTKHGVTALVTLNGAGDPARVEYAITDTGTGSVAEGSDRWQHAARITATGTVTIAPVPSDRRVWVRAVSDPAGPTLPSVYAVAGGVGYVATAAITTPSSVLVDQEEATRARGTWVNGDTSYGIEVLLDTVRLALLPPIQQLGPGTEHWMKNLTASTTYNSPGFGVRHYDPWGGVSATASDAFATTATQATADDPAGPLYVIIGNTTAGPSRSTDADGNLHTGIKLGWRLNDATIGLGTELQRAPDSAGAPGTWARLVELDPGTITYTDMLPPGGLYWYRHRHIDDSLLDGDFTDSIGPIGPAVLPRPDLDIDGRQRKRSDPFDDGEHAASGDVGGDIASGVRIYEGTTLYALGRHIETGSARDGDAVTFGSAYAAPPDIILVPESVVVFDTSFGSGSDQEVRLLASDKSTTGFTAYAKIVQAGTVTSRAVDFPAANSLTAVDATTEVALGANAPSVDDSYTLHYDVTLEAIVDLGAGPSEKTTVSATVAVESDDTGLGAWETRETALYTCAQTGVGTNLCSFADRSVSLTHPGSSSATEVRIRIHAITSMIAPTGGSVTVTVHGHNAATDGDSPDGVTWETATDTVASATPQASNRVRWFAVEST